MFGCGRISLDGVLIPDVVEALASFCTRLNALIKKRYQRPAFTDVLLLRDARNLLGQFDRHRKTPAHCVARTALVSALLLFGSFMLAFFRAGCRFLMHSSTLHETHHFAPFRSASLYM